MDLNNLPKNYAKHLGFNDDEYKALDVNILDDDKDVRKFRYSSSIRSTNR